jgi:N-formylglutamate amidohydrolase
MNDSDDVTGLEPQPEGLGDIFTLHRGSTPLLVSIPHVGTELPDALRSRYAARAVDVEDTDWHLDEVYAFVREMGASLLLPRHSRYVIDLNRPPENAPMYPGVNNTELCPTRFFTGDALYRDGTDPTTPRSRRAASATGAPTTTRSRASSPRSRRARARRAVRCAQHQVGAAVAVRRPPDRSQPRHRRRRELRTDLARRALRRC